MTVNQRTLDLIKSFEGLRLDAYRDSVGVWTIGYGTTAAAGVGIEPAAGMKITEAEAAVYLDRALAKFAAHHPGHHQADQGREQRITQQHTQRGVAQHLQAGIVGVRTAFVHAALDVAGSVCHRLPRRDGKAILVQNGKRFAAVVHALGQTADFDNP